MQAISAPLIAIGAAFIAYYGASNTRQQARTAKQKLRLDLFAVRYEVYTTVSGAVINALNEQFVGIIDRRTVNLRKAVERSRFMFDGPIFEYLNEVETCVLRYRSALTHIRKPPSEMNSEYKEIIDNFHADGCKLLEFMNVLPLKLMPYLRVDDDLSFSTSHESMERKSLVKRYYDRRN